VENHAALLCSLLLGFGLNAYVCLGTKAKSSPHAWVVTIGPDDGSVTFWESLSANRYKLRYVCCALCHGGSLLQSSIILVVMLIYGCRSVLLWSVVELAIFKNQKNNILYHFFKKLLDSLFEMIDSIEVIRFYFWIYFYYRNVLLQFSLISRPIVCDKYDIDILI